MKSWRARKKFVAMPRRETRKATVRVAFIYFFFPHHSSEISRASPHRLFSIIRLISCFLVCTCMYVFGYMCVSFFLPFLFFFFRNDPPEIRWRFYFIFYCFLEAKMAMCVRLPLLRKKRRFLIASYGGSRMVVFSGRRSVFLLEALLCGCGIR